MQRMRPTLQTSCSADRRVLRTPGTLDASHHERSARCRRVSGFSLVEILVVIAIVGLLLTLLLPAVLKARGAARRIACSNHLRQLSIACLHYATVQETFPPGLHQFEVSTPPRFRGNSWFTFLLPHLESGELLTDWNYAYPLQNTRGGIHAPTASVLPLLICPADVIETNPVRVAGRYYGVTSYGGNGGSQSYPSRQATVDGIFHTTGPASDPVSDQRPVRLPEIVDGTTQTVLCGERFHHDVNYDSYSIVSWTDPLTYLGRWSAIGGRQRIADVTMSAWGGVNWTVPTPHPLDDPSDHESPSHADFDAWETRRKCGFGSGHTGGANFAFADGHQRFLSDSIRELLLAALCTRDGEEPGVLPP